MKSTWITYFLGQLSIYSSSCNLVLPISAVSSFLILLIFCVQIYANRSITKHLKEHLLKILSDISQSFTECLGIAEWNYNTGKKTKVFFSFFSVKVNQPLPLETRSNYCHLLITASLLPVGHQVSTNTGV